MTEEIRNLNEERKKRKHNEKIGALLDLGFCLALVLVFGLIMLVVGGCVEVAV